MLIACFSLLCKQPFQACRQHVPDYPNQPPHTVTQSRTKAGRGADRAPRHPKGYWLDDAVLLRELVPYLKPVARAKLQALGGRLAVPRPGRGSAPPSPTLAPGMSKPERAQFRLPVLAELRRQGNYALINAIARRGGLTAVADHLGFQASRWAKHLRPTWMISEYSLVTGLDPCNCMKGQNELLPA